MQNIVVCPDCKRKLIGEELDTHICPDDKIVKLEVNSRPVLIPLKGKTLVLADATDGHTYVISFNKVRPQIEAPL